MPIVLSPEARLVADFVTDASSAADGDGFRRAVLSRLDRVLGFDSAIFIPFAGPAVPAGSPTFVHKEAYRQLFQRYAARPSRYAADHARLAAIAAMNRGCYVDTAVLSTKERRERRFYRDIVQPQGITSQIGAYTTFQGRTNGVIYLCRHGRGEGFRSAHLDTLFPALPALALAHAALLPPKPASDTSDIITGSIEELTRREQQIVHLLARGFRNKDIAAALGTSPNTVRNQLTAIFAKVGAPGRTALALWGAGRSDRRRDA